MLWRHYCTETKCLIYAADSNDRDSVEDELLAFSVPDGRYFDSFQKLYIFLLPCLLKPILNDLGN